MIQERLNGNTTKVSYTHLVILTSPENERLFHPFLVTFYVFQLKFVSNFITKFIVHIPTLGNISNGFNYIVFFKS